MREGESKTKDISKDTLFFQNSFANERAARYEIHRVISASKFRVVRQMIVSHLFFSPFSPSKNLLPLLQRKQEKKNTNLLEDEEPSFWCAWMCAAMSRISSMRGLTR